MATVRVEPSGIEFVANPDETIMGAAERAGYKWPTICSGEGQCHVCYLVVEAGEDALSPVEALEQEGVDALKIVAARHKKPVRLACQARLSGNITVRRPGVIKRPE